MDNILIEQCDGYKIIYNPSELNVYIEIEYNTDTSIQHPKNRMKILSDTPLKRGEYK